jgi:NAD(P)-dependent dehydrogenase (short-subunit alcohol dehydrogenase family)
MSNGQNQEVLNVAQNNIGPRRLEGRRILITGAASGMGEAIAKTFAREGASLLLLDVNAEGLAAISAVSGGIAWKTDVTSEAEVEAAVAEAVARFGGLDGVINAAGIIASGPFLETDLATWRRLHEVNLFGPCNVCRYAIPELLKSSDPTIVNIASTSALRPHANFSAYSATKAGLLSLTRILAVEHAPTLRVNAICPGPIRTPMMAERWAPTEEAGQAKAKQYVALGRRGEASEIADAALYLTSAESSFMNGSNLVLDGGASYA